MTYRENLIELPLANLVSIAMKRWPLPKGREAARFNLIDREAERAFLCLDSDFGEPDDQQTRRVFAAIREMTSAPDFSP